MSLSSGQNVIVLQGAGAATSAIGAYSAARSAQSSLDYQAGLADINSKQAELAAQQELFRGNAAVAQSTARAGQIKSAQRASMAANGIDLGEGSAVDVLTSTDLMKENDTNTITANAVRAAWGMRAQATNYKNEATAKRASADSINPFMNGASSLLGSASSLAQNYYNLNKTGAAGFDNWGATGSGM